MTVVWKLCEFGWLPKSAWESINNVLQHLTDIVHFFSKKTFIVIISYHYALSIVKLTEKVITGFPTTDQQNKHSI